jgi:hypothetical protein
MDSPANMTRANFVNETLVWMFRALVLYAVTQAARDVHDTRIAVASLSATQQSIIRRLERIEAKQQP